MNPIILEGMLEDPESDDGGSALILYNFAATEGYGDDEVPGLAVTLTSLHYCDEDGPAPSHPFFTENMGKKLRITIEVVD